MSQHDRIKSLLQSIELSTHEAYDAYRDGDFEKTEEILFRVEDELATVSNLVERKVLDEAIDLNVEEEV
jgi:hypothetical protein